MNLRRLLCTLLGSCSLPPVWERPHVRHQSNTCRRCGLTYWRPTR